MPEPAYRRGRYNVTEAGRKAQQAGNRARMGVYTSPLLCTCGKEPHKYNCPAYIVLKQRERRERLRKEKEGEGDV